ncbi:MAG: hypothetical protein QY318_01765 [Candidatus Dojkabacteria bacterium]|nr:MAG: hypothetical protein QY318_01765 [Candidatus Dojkabacteria bacterium]
MNAKRRKIAFLILFPLVSIIAIMTSLLINKQITIVEKSSLVEENEEEKVAERVTGIPMIVTVAPQNAYEDLPFSYIVKVADSDSPTEDISLRIVEGPSWMDLRNGYELYGIPVITGDETVKVVVEVSDGIHETTQTFYLLIHRENEDAN